MFSSLDALNAVMHVAGAFLLFGSAIGAALPEPGITSVSPFCAVVTKVVTLAKAQSTATAFCSSYLNIKPTATVTSYVATVFPTDYPCYQTTVARRDAGADAIPSANNAIDVNGELKKRAIAKPACFNGYKLAAEISSACSCLKIPAGTSTVKATATSSDFYVKAKYNNNYVLNRFFPDTGRTELAFIAASPADSIIFKLATYDPDYPCLLSNGDSSGQLASSNAYQLRVDPNTDQTIIYDTGGFFYQKERHRGVVCRITKGANTLLCQTGVGPKNTVSGDAWYIGDGSVGTPLELTIIPAIQAPT